MRNPRIFGREPVVISNAIEGILAMLLAFNLLGFAGVDSAEAMAILMAVVSSVMGLYVAYITKDTLLAATVGVVKAAAALIAAYGYEMTEIQLAQTIAAITVVSALWGRTQTGPAVDPSLNLNQHSFEVPPELESTSPVDDLSPTPTVTLTSRKE